MTPEPDYSIYTLRQLLETRQWFDADGYSRRIARLEEEIQKRCAHLQGETSRKGSTTRGSGGRYRHYGLIFGAIVLAVSIGPMLVFELLGMMGLINADDALLWALWALFTLPAAVLVFLVGGIMDVERVVKRFGL